MCQQELPNGPVAGDAFSPRSADKQADTVITWDELAKHNTIDDAWIAIKGRVYDVTKFATSHPGGPIIFTAAGLDATDVFSGFHASTSSWRYLPPLCVGVLADPHSPPFPNVDAEYVKDVVEMRKQVQSLRLFDSSKLYYLYKVFSNVSIAAISILLALYQQSYVGIFVSAVIMALFWQQCGWLAHDFLHHQVFLHRGLNNIAGVLIGNVFQGFSVAWWKAKHNHHHAVPNVTDAPAGGDPDIATTPILFWSEKLVEGDDLASLPRWMLRNQSILYWPVLCMARISWVLQSLQHQFLPRNPKVTSDTMYAAELAGLALHYVWYMVLVAAIAMSASFLKAAFFVAVSQAAGGVLLGVVFAVGHNAMDVLTLDELRAVDFVRLQVRTTRNVDPFWFTDWFTGGLNYQVEHHIFPTVPRHNLPKLAKILRAFCHKHSIPYTSQTLMEGNKAVTGILRQVSKLA